MSPTNAPAAAILCKPHWPPPRRTSEKPDPSNASLEVPSKQDGTLPHMKNFLECVRTRNTPNASIEVGVSAARAGHVANLAMRGSGVWMG